MVLLRAKAIVMRSMRHLTVLLQHAVLPAALVAIALISIDARGASAKRVTGEAVDHYYNQSCQLYSTISCIAEMDNFRNGLLNAWRVIDDDQSARGGVVPKFTWRTPICAWSFSANMRFHSAVRRSRRQISDVGSPEVVPPTMYIADSSFENSQRAPSRSEGTPSPPNGVVTSSPGGAL